MTEMPFAAFGSYAHHLGDHRNCNHAQDINLVVPIPGTPASSADAAKVEVRDVSNEDKKKPKKAAGLPFVLPQPPAAAASKAAAPAPKGSAAAGASPFTLGPGGFNFNNMPAGSMPSGAPGSKAMSTMLAGLMQSMPSVMSGFAGEDTRNDLKKSGCPNAVLIFARGTIEPGNMGLIIGPAMENAIKKRRANIAVQGVDYNTVDFQNGFATGVKNMVQLADDTATRCPKTRMILSGYSQGAMVCHTTISKLKKETLNHIAAVVTFGDPPYGLTMSPAQLKPKSKVFCRKDDPICMGVGTGTGSHLSYGVSGDDAVKYMLSQLKQ
jgi:predicted esterase